MTFCRGTDYVAVGCHNGGAKESRGVGRGLENPRAAVVIWTISLFSNFIYVLKVCLMHCDTQIDPRRRLLNQLSTVHAVQ